MAAREKEFTTLSAIITAFAQLCASHERIIKQVNAQLLRRASTIGGTASTAISINAIQLLDSVWKTVGDELAEFVPESIPTLLELLESDSADIAQAAQALIKTIEGRCFMLTLLGVIVFEVLNIFSSLSFRCDGRAS